jgi:acyl dehydratase
MVELIPQDRLYLDDLYVGQRFASATDTIDEAQIKAFAARFDPQPFHIDEKAAEDYHASQCRGRLALGGRNHRGRRRAGLAGPDTPWRYAPR